MTKIYFLADEIDTADFYLGEVAMGDERRLTEAFLEEGRRVGADEPVGSFWAHMPDGSLWVRIQTWICVVEARSRGIGGEMTARLDRAEAFPWPVFEPSEADFREGVLAKWDMVGDEVHYAQRRTVEHEMDMILRLVGNVWNVTSTSAECSSFLSMPKEIPAEIVVRTFTQVLMAEGAMD